MINIKEMSDDEKLEFYRNNCTFDELAKMHIELLKHVPPPSIYYNYYIGKGDGFVGTSSPIPTESK